jgi:V8-like Glu-specific endopeptidase
MFTSTLPRRLRLGVPLAVTALLALPAITHADSSGRCAGTGVPCFIEHDTGPHIGFQFDSGPFSGDPYTLEIPCLSTEEGTVTPTGDETGRGNLDPDPDAHWVHFHGRYVETGRVDFPSGMYVLYRFEARGGDQVGDTRTTITHTETGTWRGTVYDADGNPTGQVVKEHVITHYTFIDSGDAGNPFDSDPTDTFLAKVIRTRWTCS